MRFSLVTGLLLMTQLTVAQYDVDDVNADSTESKLDLYKIRQRTYVGGDFSVLLGTNTYLYLSPILGYDIYPTFSAGISTMYQLIRFKYPNGAVVAEHAFGGGVFLRYRPLPFLLVQSEFDMYNVVDHSVFPTGRQNIPALLSGLGYAGSMGDRAYYNILLMYDLIHNPHMPLPKLFNAYPVYLKYGFVFYLG